MECVMENMNESASFAAWFFFIAADEAMCTSYHSPKAEKSFDNSRRNL